MIRVEGDGFYVLDLSFADRPLREKDWLIRFLPAGVYNKECVRIKALSEFNREGSVPCAIMYSSMYNMWPSSVRKNYSYSQWKCDDLISVVRNLDPPIFYEWEDLEDFVPEKCKGRASLSWRIQKIIDEALLNNNALDVNESGIPIECRNSVSSWTYHFVGDEQRSIISKLACVDNNLEPTEVTSCLDKVFFWVNENAIASHKRYISALACSGGSHAKEIIPCLTKAYKWTSKNADSYHRREVAALACSYNYPAQKVKSCLEEGWNNSSFVDPNFRRIDAVENCVRDHRKNMSQYSSEEEGPVY